MRKLRDVAPYLVSAATLITLTSCGAAESTSHVALSVQSESSSEPVATDQTVALPQDEQLVPAPAGTTPTLTAAAAYADFESHVGSATTAIPGDVKVVLGDLTLPSDPQDPAEAQNFVVHDQLAYGYETPNSCAPNTGPPGRTTNLCTQWLFLSANTGVQLDETYGP